MRGGVARLLLFAGVLALVLACHDAPTRPVVPPPERTPFVRARSAIDSLNIALFELWRAQEAVTLLFYIDSLGLIQLGIRAEAITTP